MSQIRDDRLSGQVIKLALRLATSWSTIILLFVAFALANIFPWTVGQEPPFVTYGFPVTYLLAGRPWPTLVGDPVSWLPNRVEPIGPVSKAGIAFDVAFAIVTFNVLYQLRRFRPRCKGAWRISIRSLFLATTGAAGVVAFIAYGRQPSDKVLVATEAVNRLGGQIGTKWNGPQYAERLGLDAYLPRWMAVNTIILRGKSLDQDGVAQLRTVLAENPQLTILDLASTGITDAEVASLPEVASLQLLDLSNNPIDGTVLRRAAILANVEQLTIGESSRQPLRIPKNAVCLSVKDLSFYGSVIDADSIANLDQFEQLKRIDLMNSESTNDAIERLRQTRTDLHVELHD